MKVKNKVCFKHKIIIMTHGPMKVKNKVCFKHTIIITTHGPMKVKNKVCFKHKERRSACLIREFLRPAKQLNEQCGHEEHQLQAIR